MNSPLAELHLLPLLQPQKEVKPPLHRLRGGPFPPERIAFVIGSTPWVSSKHVFPAAFPRSQLHATHGPGPAMIEPRLETLESGKEAYRRICRENMQRFQKELLYCPSEAAYPPRSKEEADQIARSLADSGQPQLWSCIERIIPAGKAFANKQGRPLTLLLSHATGFHKEIYEPMLQALLSEVESDGNGAFVEEIWSLDTFNSGDAGMMNRGTLSICTPWWDHARDMQQFLEYFLPARSEKADVLLNRRTKETYRQDRTIIALTHSHSGAAASMLLTRISDLCAGHISIDPMVFKFDDARRAALTAKNSLCEGAMIRKDVFSDRQAIVDYMESKPYFRTWDRRVRKNHALYGFCPIPGNEVGGDGPLTLCMSKWSEASQFAFSWCGAWGALELERPESKGFIHFIWTKFVHTIPELQRARKEIMFNFARLGDQFSCSDWDTNHLVVQENPDFAGKEVARIIMQKALTDGKNIAKSSKI